MTEQDLIELIKSKGFNYVKIDKEEHIKAVYEMYANDVIIQDNDDTDALVLDYIGLYYSMKNNDELCEKFYKISADKGCVVAMTNLGSHYKHKGDDENMKKYYYMALDHADNDYNNTTLNEYCKNSKEESDQLISYYLDKIENFPDKYMYIYFLADFYHRCNYNKLAIKHYLKVLKINADHHHCISKLGNVYESMNDYNEAIKYYSMLNDNLKYYQIGNCYQKMKNNELAIKNMIIYMNNANVSDVEQSIIESIINVYKEEQLTDEYCKFISYFAFKGSTICEEEFKKNILRNFIALDHWIIKIRERKVEDLSDKDNNCPVCLHEFDDSNDNDTDTKHITLLCGHKYCELCLRHIINKKEYKCGLCTKLIC